MVEPQVRTYLYVWSIKVKIQFVGWHNPYDRWYESCDDKANAIICLCSQPYVMQRYSVTRSLYITDRQKLCTYQAV